LAELLRGLGDNTKDQDYLWQSQEGPPLPLERKLYLEAVYDEIST